MNMSSEGIKPGLSLKPATAAQISGAQLSPAVSEASASFTKQAMLALDGAAKRAAGEDAVDSKSLSPKPPVMRSAEEIAHIAYANVTGNVNRADFPQDINKSLAGIKEAVGAKESKLAEAYGFKPQQPEGLTGDALVLNLAQRLDQATRMETAYVGVAATSMPGTIGGFGMASAPRSSSSTQQA